MKLESPLAGYPTVKMIQDIADGIVLRLVRRILQLVQPELLQLIDQRLTVYPVPQKLPPRRQQGIVGPR